jgi:SAM-dependent methyltransferase
MELRRRLLGHSHHHGDESGGVIVRPRLYALIAEVFFGGFNLPFADASFDLVVSSPAVHHISADHRPNACSKMFRVLRPGGRLFIAEFRAPRSRVGNHLIGFLTSHAMEDQHAINIEFLAEAAGFHVDELGEQRPFLHGMIADRPAS